MDVSEKTLLLAHSERKNGGGLSVIFAAICIVDIFGVFPIVALPKAIIQCGFYGVLIVTIVISLQIYTSVLLGKCWLLAEKMEPSIQDKNRYPFCALARLTFGKHASRLVMVLLDTTIFAGGIPNLLVAAQNLELLGRRLSEDTFNFSYCYWIILLGMVICPFLWLGSPKDMKLLCALSVFLVGSVFLLVFVTIVLDTRTVNEEVDNSNVPIWNSALTAYGILVFQFDIHPTILTIQVDMTDKTKFWRSIMYGFAVSVGIFSIITTSAAVKYGLATHWSLLDTLPSTVVLHLAAFLVAIQLSITSAVSNSALYQHLEDTLGIKREFNRKRCLIRTFLTILAILLAESVPRFDLVMSMIGGALTGPIVFILPPLIYIKMVFLEKRREKYITEGPVINIDSTSTTSEFQSSVENLQMFAANIPPRTVLSVQDRINFILCIFISIFGVFSVISITYVNVINTIEYANFSQPCIYDLVLYLH